MPINKNKLHTKKPEWWSCVRTVNNCRIGETWCYVKSQTEQNIAVLIEEYGTFSKVILCEESENKNIYPTCHTSLSRNLDLAFFRYFEQRE